VTHHRQCHDAEHVSKIKHQNITPAVGSSTLQAQ
jgi:hypothetical protein